RFLDTDDDKVTTGGLWNDVRRREVSFLPAVWFFRQFPVRIINMNRHLCPIDFCSQPEPIFIPFEQLLPNRLFLSRTEVTSPVVLTYLKSLFYIWFCRLKSKRLCVIHRGEAGVLHYDRGRQHGARDKNLCETVHRSFLISGDNAVAHPRRDIIDLLNGFRRNSRGANVNERLHFGQSALNLVNEWEVKLGHCLQSCLKVSQEIGLMQKLGPVGGEMLLHHRGQHFRAPQPPTKTNELR